MSFVSLKEIELHMTFLISIKITTRRRHCSAIVMCKIFVKNSNQHVRFTSRIQLLRLQYMILFRLTYLKLLILNKVLEKYHINDL